jgi:hypothetical protein
VVVGLKLLGAAVAVWAVIARPASAVRTVLVWGAFALLAVYSAGNVVELLGMLVSDPGAIAPRGLAYIAFFLVGAVGYGVLAVLGVLGAPLVLGALLVGAPALLAAMGLFPSP